MRAGGAYAILPLNAGLQAARGDARRGCPGKIRVLGCHGSEQLVERDGKAFQRRTCGFLVNGTVMIDAGTIGAALRLEEQKQIRHILLSHLHFDHVQGLPTLADNLVEEETDAVEPVVLTSPFAWEELTPDANPSASSGEKTGQIPLVVASTRSVQSAENKRFDEARLAVFGASQILVDANWGHDPNRNLVMNAFAWATTQVNKITIRPPDRDISTVEIDDRLMSRIRFVATDLAPISLLAVGLAVWLSRRSK